MDSIRALLGVANESRYKKLSADRNWSLPQALREKLSEVENLALLVQVDTTPDSGNETNANTEGYSKQNDNKNYTQNMCGNHLKPEGDSQVFDSSRKIASQESIQRPSVKPSIVGRAKSNKKNNIYRGRMVSYVSKERTLGEATNANQSPHNKILGNKAEEIVLNDLVSRGFNVKKMPENNEGYDIEAIDLATGEVLYVEVKGGSSRWSEKGVGISKSQYLFAQKYQNHFILAIVDNLDDNPSLPVYLCNPVDSITEYRFDHGWEGLKVNLAVAAGNMHVLNPVEERIALTESIICKALIEYCHDNVLPVPEVGVELEDENGAVICEIELCWEKEHVGILLSEGELKRAQTFTIGWTFELALELDIMKRWLHKVLSVPEGELDMAHI